ncbi:MAG: hypothetical protein ACE5FU_08625, partial [Nitrospinota bacterium]
MADVKNDSLLQMRKDSSPVDQYILSSFRRHPLLWLTGILMVRHVAALYFHGATFYADEYKDYFTTLHGLVHDHRLGEWYTRTNMRSYVILMPLLPFVYFFKVAGFTDLYILELIVKAVIGLCSGLTLFFLFKFVELLAGVRRAVFISAIYILHPVNIYFNYSILTEQAAALTFFLSLWVIQFLLTRKIQTGALLFSLFFLFWLSAGFSVLARLDSLFFMGPLVLYYLWKQRKNPNLGLFFASFLAVFVLYGVLEYLFTGQFYGPQVNRFMYEGVKRMGVIGSVANRASIIEDLGGNVFYPFLLVAGYYFFKTLRKPTIFHFPILFFILFHTWLPHKEFRYVFPIAMVIIAFLFCHLPEDFLAFNKKMKRVKLFWILTAGNWVAITFFFTPWGGQPLLSQQISYVQHHYKNVPVYVASPPDTLPGAEWDPFLKVLDHSRVTPEAQIENKNFILFVHDDFRQPWTPFLSQNSCKEIYRLRKDAKGNIKPDFFI